MAQDTLLSRGSWELCPVRVSGDHCQKLRTISEHGSCGTGRSFPGNVSGAYSMKILALPFDPWTAIVTLTVAPVFYFILRILARHLQLWSGFATEGVLHGLSRFFMHGLSARISLRRYCRLVIASTRYVAV